MRTMRAPRQVFEQLLYEKVLCLALPGPTHERGVVDEFPRGTIQCLPILKNWLSSAPLCLGLIFFLNF